MGQTHQKITERKTSAGCLHQKNDRENSQVGRDGAIDFGKTNLDITIIITYNQTVNPNKKVNKMKNIIVFLTAVLFTVSVSAQTPAPKKEEAKPAAPAACVEKDKDGKAIIDKATGKPVVCPKKDEKKAEPAKK